MPWMTGLGAAIDAQRNHRQLRPDEAARPELSGQVFLLPREQGLDHLPGRVGGADDGIPGLNRSRQQAGKTVHRPGGGEGVVHAAQAPGSGTVKLALPGLRRVDGTRCEETSDPFQCSRLGRNDVIGRAVGAEVLDEPTEFVAQFRILHISCNGLSGSMAGECREEAVTGKMATHRLTMGHLISFGLEMDRCGHVGGLEWIVIP